MNTVATKSSGAKAPEKARLQVRVTANARQKDLVVAFRDRIMVKELGLPPQSQNANNWLDHGTRDEAAQHLFLLAGKSIVGCLRCHNSDMVAPNRLMTKVFNLPAFDEFGPAALSFTDHMVIGSDWRGSQAPAMLTAAAFKLARSQGAKFDFTYCPPALVGLYEKIGYRCHSNEYLDTNAGLQVPLVLVMDDVEHLKTINSPFAALAAQQTPDQNVAKWFAQRFPEAAEREVKSVRDEQRLWNYLSKQLHQNPLYGIQLFDDLSYDEAQRFLKNSTTMALRAGDVLARTGDVGEEAFVLLSGELVITSRQGAVLSRQGKGGIVGEIAYLAATPRSADMIVTKDAEVLVLTQDMFRNVMKTEPGIACKILFNLTLILAKRLVATSAQLNANAQLH